MTQSDVVNYLINIDKELLNTYEIYQRILYSIKNNKYNELEIILNIKNEYIESTKDTKLLKVNDKFNTLAFAICITKESVIIKDYDYVEVCLVNNKEPDNNDLNTLLAYSIK